MEEDSGEERGEELDLSELRLLGKYLREVILAEHEHDPDAQCDCGFSFLDALAYCDPKSAAAAVQKKERARLFEAHLQMGCLLCSAWIGELRVDMREEEEQKARAVGSGRGYAPMPPSSGGVAPRPPDQLPLNPDGIDPSSVVGSGGKKIS